MMRTTYTTTAAYGADLPVRLTEAEVAERLKLHKRTLSRARLEGHPLLPYVRISPRGIRYDAATVQAHLERATRNAEVLEVPSPGEASALAAGREAAQITKEPT